MFSFDHNYSQGLVLQQNYGGGIGATLFKKKDSEFDVTTDLHFEKQQFNANGDRRSRSSIFTWSDHH